MTAKRRTKQNSQGEGELLSGRDFLLDLNSIHPEKRDHDEFPKYKYHYPGCRNKEEDDMIDKLDRKYSKGESR